MRVEHIIDNVFRGLLAGNKLTSKYEQSLKLLFEYSRFCDVFYDLAPREERVEIFSFLSDLIVKANEEDKVILNNIYKLLEAEMYLAS